MAGAATLERPRTEAGGAGNGEFVPPSTPFNDGDNGGEQAIREAETHVREYARTYVMAQRIRDVSRNFQTLEQRVTNPMRQAVAINSGRLILNGEMPVLLN